MADPLTEPVQTAPQAGIQSPEFFGIEDTARRVGHYIWAETKLFEVLGAWVATVPEWGVKLRLGTHCQQHAWHAELWNERLPALPGLDGDRLTIPPNETLVAFVEAVAEPAAAERTLEKLVGVYRVFIPHLISAYTFHLNTTSPITDAPTIRALSLILHDEFDERREGELLIQSLLASPDDVGLAAAHHSRIEQLIVAGGGIAGPGSIGG